MSGHNKWSKIKHKKAASDAKRSKIFGKLTRLIAAQSKKVGGDITTPSLRAAIEKARAENMPTDNIERAVAKGKIDEGASMEEVTYETYGPGGVAMVIEGLTDNRNRTAAELKHLLSQHSLELAAPGSASWAFTKVGAEWRPNTTVSISESDGEKLGVLIDALENHDDVQGVFVNTV